MSVCMYVFAWAEKECWLTHVSCLQSPALKGFDPFQVEKEAAFESALPGMESVAQFLQTRLQVLDKTRENGDERDSSIAASLRHLILVSVQLVSLYTAWVNIAKGWSSKKCWCRTKTFPKAVKLILLQ